MTKETKLKLCPFCGGSAKTRKIDKPAVALVNHPYSRWKVICLLCQVRTGWYETEFIAVKAWNTRKGESND